MQLLRHLSITMLLLILTACGGGDGGLSNGETPDQGTDTGDIINIELSISALELSASSPITVTAILTNDGEAVVGKEVQFVLDTGDKDTASFAIDNPVVGTDSNGVATIQIFVGTESGGATVSVVVEDFTSPSATFNSAGDAPDQGPGDLEPTASQISLFASTQQLASSGAQEIELTSIVKDDDNNLVQGAVVSFSSDSGQIQVTKGVTEADGQATATLRTSNEPTNRVINILATSGLVTDEVAVEVIGTDVQLSGSSSLALNDENTYIVKVLDSDGNGIVNTEVLLALEDSSGANISLPSSVITDFTGQATFNAVGTTGGSNAISASALGASTSQTVTVQADSFLFTNFNNMNGDFNPDSSLPEVGLSDSATLTLEWLRSGVPVPDGTLISFTTTRGTLSTNSASTVNGRVSVSVMSSNAGNALVTFTGAEGQITLNNQLEFEFIAETVDTIVAQASPASLGPNAQSSVISIIAKDANGNLVKNKTVDFSLNDSNGGTIFPASDVTDSNGGASTVYTSKSVSAKNGVSITATLREDSTKQDTINLTVADRELFLSLGTGNEIEEVDLTTYNKKYVVFVTDVDSTPQKDVEIKVSAIPKFYHKGLWVKRFDESGEFVSWGAAINEAIGVQVDDDNDPNSPTVTQFVTVGTTCANEDINQDGILDPGEDLNNDGILTPGNIVAVAGDVKTDEQGRAVIDILYPQSYGSWSDIDLIVTAKVTGTEYLERTVFTLSVLSSDVTDEKVNPPTQGVGLDSPFGHSTNCFDTN